jgi:predicted DsbA family dithiol-disulfide isomerase
MMKAKGVKDLTVFVSNHCFNCKESLLIAQRIRQQYPKVRVTVRDIDKEEPCPNIFAVPTYVLDGKVAFFGNPTEKQIRELLRGAPAKESERAEEFSV